eukprot:scaffold190449_cov43-Cyclotella_meneghiniana.AAC.1
MEQPKEKLLIKAQRKRGKGGISRALSWLAEMHLVAALWVEGNVPIGDSGSCGSAYRGSAISPTTEVLAKWKGQWLPTGGQCHWGFSKVVRHEVETGSRRFGAKDA